MTGRLPHPTIIGDEHSTASAPSTFNLNVRTKNMIINCDYYAPHNHTLLSEHLEADLARIADFGTDAVSVCVQESQLTN